MGHYCTLDGFTILDTLIYKEQMYFLGIDAEENYKIIKVISVHERNPLSDNKVLKKVEIFGNPARWNAKTRLIIDDDGKVVGAETNNSETYSKAGFTSIFILIF